MAKEPLIILLKSADNVIFKVKPSIVKEMKIVQSFIEADNAAITATPIPLPNVFSPQLSMIINYVQQHSQGAGKKFDAKFLKGVSNKELRDLLLAVDYLNIDGLLDFLIQVAVDYLKIDGFLDLLTPDIAERIQKKRMENKNLMRLFGIQNDYTPEEESKLLEAIAWAFNGLDDDEVFNE